MPAPAIRRSRETPEGKSATAGQGDDGEPVPLQHFLTRQPVLDDGYRVAGFELMLREKADFTLVPGAETLQQALDEALLVSTIDLDFRNAFGDRTIFLSVAPVTLFNPMVEQLPAGKVVLAIRPFRQQTDLLARCDTLVRSGIDVAVDDADDKPELASLLKLCTYARLNASRDDVVTLGERVARLRSLGVSRLVATRVETEELFEACRKLTVNLFQGYYFARLRPALPHRIDTNRMRVMELLNLVVNRAEFIQLEERFKLDPGLSYKLLRFINSPAIGLRQEIGSIRQALILLGHDQIYRWLTLLLFTAGQPDRRSQAMFKNALVRARFTESLGEKRVSPEHRGGLFLVGILSMMDALLNQPMTQALEPLKLPQAVVDALIGGTGVYAPYLQLAVACEQFDQDSIARRADEVGLSADEVNLAHVHALIWAEGLEV